MQEAAQPSIAIVDLQYILENSLAIKDLRAQIETITKDLHDKMTQKELDLKKDEENLIRLKGKILPNESEKEASNFNKKVTEAQKYAQQQKLKLEKAHSEGILQVHSGTIKVIKEICEAKGFVLVLPSSQILYANDSLNITQEVLDTLNKQIKTIKVQF
jgi:Skp family chaperone for outer membrane proteins